MTTRRNGRSYECVVIDVNTQRDFCEPTGRNPVDNIERLIPALRRMIAWTKRNGAAMVSSIDSHRRSEFRTNGHPLCCIDGSNGQRKLPFTMFPCSLRVEFDNTLGVPMDLFDRYQQLIFRQRTDDLLSNPKADQFLTHLRADEYILFGNTLEGAVKALALGLRTREKQVTVVVDACGHWDAGAADLALRLMEAKGARVISVEDHLRRVLHDRFRYRPIDTERVGSNGRARNGLGVGARTRISYGNGRNHRHEPDSAPRLPGMPHPSRMLDPGGQAPRANP